MESPGDLRLKDGAEAADKAIEERRVFGVTSGAEMMRSLRITDVCFGIILSALAFCLFPPSIAQGDDKADTYYQRGFTFFQNKEYEQAIDEYSKAISANKTDSRYYYVRGVAYIMQGRRIRALDDFSEAVRMNPQFADAYGAAASVFLLEGLYPLAIEFYTTAISLNPADAPDLLFSRGVSHQRMNDRESAVADFQAACKQGSKVGCLFWNAMTGQSL